MASETSKHVIVDFANSNTSNNNTVTASTRFRWDKEQKVENLIRCLANYKAKMEFSNKDFNADKVQQYEEVRKYFFLRQQKTFPAINSRHIKSRQNSPENFSTRADNFNHYKISALPRAEISAQG